MVFSNVFVFFPLIVFPSDGFTPWSKNSHQRGKVKGKGIVKKGKGENRKGKGKGKGKEKERERKGKGKRKRKEKESERKRKGKRKEKETKKERKRERKKDRKKERRRKRKSQGRDRKKERKGRGKGGKKAVSHTDHFWCQKWSFSLSFCYRSWSLCVPCFSGNGCNHQKRSVATTYQAPSLCRICAITATNHERKRPKALNSRRVMEKIKNFGFQESGHRSLT